MDEVIAFVGRDSQVETVRGWVEAGSWRASDPKVRVCAISGPGGVGKSRLYREALTPELLAAGAYLMIELQGHRHRETAQLFEWFRIIVASIKEPLPRTEKCLRWHDELIARADEIRWQDPDGNDMGELVKSLISAGLAAGRGVGGTLDVRELGESAGHIKSAFDLLTRSTRMRRMWDGPRFRRFGRNPKRALADAFVADLEALLTRGRSDGSSRLLLILDDFEWVDIGLGEFLHNWLVPRLRGALFQSVVLMVGRDRIHNVRGGIWQQSESAATLARQSVFLTPLTEEHVLRYCQGLGIDGDVAHHVYLESQGYPWLVEMVADEVSASGEGLPATAYQNFFTRTTRFMSDEEVTWLKAVAFLDVINEDTIPTVLPDVKASRVYGWFIDEPSIRDTNAARYSVWPFIRYRILRLQWLRSPAQFRALHAASGSEWPLNAETQEPLRPGERSD